jgi:hypothetical protein
MDTAYWLLETQVKFTRQSQRFSWEQFFYNLLTPPLWMIKYHDRRFCRLYRDRHILFKHGQIVWGRIVQANTQLFQPGKIDCPADIVCSPDPIFNSNIQDLVRIARELYDLKNQTIEHPEVLDLKILADALTNEMEALFNVKIPDSIALDKLVYFTTIMVHRKHIPCGYLKASWFPVLIAPDKTPASMILPARYWSPYLLKIWRSN